MSEEEMYLMKTMCLAKKTVQMPTKEEHGFLVFCGLGARKWQVQMDCNSLSFKQAILNIYPRLRSAVGYNLWTLTMDKKTFERIPEKVNTPRRIRSYLGTQFTGCLIIVPISDILLMEEKREHLRQIDLKDIPGCPRIPASQHDNDRMRRSLCMLCGKMEKMAGTGSFHKINTDEITCDEGTMPIVKKLTEILGVNIEAHRKKFIASEEICKKCLRCVIDISQMEMKLKSAKEDMINNFFTTTSRFNKNHQSSSNSSSGSHTSHSALHNDQAGSERNGHGVHENGNSDQFNFQQGVLVPSLPRPLAFIDPRQSAYGPPPDMYQLCSAAGFAAAAAHLKNGIRGAGSSSVGSSRNGCGSSNGGEQINYVRNPDYRSRPGSDYAPSEVGSSSYISVSPPRCEMNGGSTECSEPPASPHHTTFDQQSLASTFSFSSQSSASMLKSKAQYKDYNYAEEEERAGPSSSRNKQDTEAKDYSREQADKEYSRDKVDKDYSREPTDYTISTTEDKCEVNQSSEVDHGAADKLIAAEDTQHAAPQSTKDIVRSSPTNLSYVSSGPSPPSSCSGARSDSGSPARGSPSSSHPEDEDSKRPVKKRKRLNNSDEADNITEDVKKIKQTDKEEEY